MPNPPIGKIVSWGVIIFILYAIFTAPVLSADKALTLWGITVSGTQNVTTFFSALLAN